MHGAISFERRIAQKVLGEDWETWARFSLFNKCRNYCAFKGQPDTVRQTTHSASLASSGQLGTGCPLPVGV